MPNVLTETEFSQICSIIRPLTMNVIRKYSRDADLGRKFDVKTLNKVRMICYLRNLIVDTWEQSKFTNEQKTNYMSDVDLRNLYSKILKLSKDV